MPWVDRALEGADGHFVVVARVDHRHIRRANEVVPVSGFNVMANARARVHVGLAHRDDLFLQPNLEAAEGLVGAGAFLPLQIGAAGQGADMVKHRVDPGAWPRDGAVDPLMCQQKRAGDALCLAQVEERARMAAGSAKRVKW